MKLVKICSTVLLFLLSAPVVTSGALSSWYTDVPDHYTYYDGIFYMTQGNYVAGHEDGTFQPEMPVTRAEAVKMILAVSEVNLTLPESAPSPFSDVDTSLWYWPYVYTANNLGIVSGDGDSLFRPTDPVNTAEVLKMLTLANQLKSELPNVASDTWHDAYMAYGKKHALILPDATGIYLPEKTYTRGELADLLYRFKKEPYTGEVEYGIGSYYGYSYNGHNTASGTPLDAYGFMAAHKTLPFGTKVRVTNLDNNTYVDVTIVDRGPYTAGYVIDLTPAAFDQIAALPTGIINVRIEVLK
jgi:rare lipoprotein A